MTVTNLIDTINEYIDEYIEVYSNTFIVIGAVLGTLSTFYHENIWWFFPPFIITLVTGLLFLIFLNKFSR